MIEGQCSPISRSLVTSQADIEPISPHGSSQAVDPGFLSPDWMEMECLE